MLLAGNDIDISEGSEVVRQQYLCGSLRRGGVEDGDDHFGERGAERRRERKARGTRSTNYRSPLPMSTHALPGDGVVTIFELISVSHIIH